MKRILRFFAVFSLTLFITNNIYSRPGGSPGGYSGAPDNSGRTCSNCHGTLQSSNNSWISSDIPSQGYTPGATYNITLTIPDNGKIGFELASQTKTGTTLGSFVAGTNSKILSSGKYITQSKALNGPTTWKFKWTAPKAGSGSVSFYGAYTINMNGMKTGVVEINENQINNVNGDYLVKELSVYPNPSVDFVKLYSDNLFNSAFSLKIVNTIGTEVFSKFYNENTNEIEIDLRSFSKGLYYLIINNGSKSISRELIIN